MSQYYKGKRSRNIYCPGSEKPFKISRSKIDLFLNCPRCFYIDRKLGVGQPPGFPFNLNSAVDELLKNEFDLYRAKGEKHPIQIEYDVDAIPHPHPELYAWRENFKGIQFHHEEANLILTGAIDDLWINSSGEFIVVDYKATSKDGVIDRLNDTWHIGYKRQMEIYQWLLRQLGHPVSNTGYFVYCNGNKKKDKFDSILEFDVRLIPYDGNDAWVSQTITDLHSCLNSDDVPDADPDCDYCTYRSAVEDVL